MIIILLDAACRVNFLERGDNSNKQWNHWVERELSKNLFAMGFGINLEEVKSKDRVRALTGEKDIFKNLIDHLLFPYSTKVILNSVYRTRYHGKIGPEGEI